MDGYEFESVCAEYLRAHGFRRVQVTQASRDQGADILAHRKKEKYAFQCKYYATPVGNKAVQEVYAAATYYGCDRAVVMTNSTFTKGAKELAESLGVELMPGIEPMKRRFGALDGMMALPVLFLIALLVIVIGKPALPKSLAFLRGERMASFATLFIVSVGLMIVGGMLFFFRQAFLGMLFCLAGAGAVWLSDAIPGKWKEGLLVLAAFGAFLCLLRAITAIPGKIRERRKRKDEEALMEQGDGLETEEESESGLQEEPDDEPETGSLKEPDDEPESGSLEEPDDEPESGSLKEPDDELTDELQEEQGVLGQEEVESEEESDWDASEEAVDAIEKKSEPETPGRDAVSDKTHRRAVLYELIGIAEKVLMDTDKPAERDRILATLEDAYKLIQEDYRRE